MEADSGCVVFLAGSERMRSAARLLAEVLLRPTVRVVGPSDLESLHTQDVVLAFDPPSDETVARLEGRFLIRMQTGSRIADSLDCRLPTGEIVRMAAARVDLEVDNGFKQALDLSNRAAAMLTMAARRHAKSSETSRSTERVEIATCADFLERTVGTTVRDRIFSMFENDPVAGVDSDWIHWYQTMFADGRSIGTTSDPRIGELASFIGRPDPERFSRFRSLFLADPALILLASRTVKSVDRDDWIRFLELLEAESRTAKRLSGVLGGAMLVNADAMIERLLLEMETLDWSFEDSSLLRMVPRKENIERSVLAASIQLVAAIRNGADPVSLLPRRTAVPLLWRTFGSKKIEEGVEPASQRCYEPDQGRLSIDLLENWLCLSEQAVPCNGQFEILPEHYGPTVHAIEHLFGCIVDDLQRRASGRVIRCRPWPSGHDFAVSIRYDADRPLHPGRIERLVDLQRRRFGRECGSWFLLKNASHSKELLSTLTATGQELGHHACDLERESFGGLGVAVHSSQRSRYWEGRRSILALDRGDALYGEAMGFTAMFGRFAWLGDATAGVWCVPLHFPLEGEVAQSDLSYFRREWEAFDRLRRLGGHLIIGAHPDCDPELLEHLCDQVDLRAGWAAPISEVMRRLRLLGAEGAIKVRIRDGEIEVRTPNSIEQLVVQIEDESGGMAMYVGDVGLDDWVTLRRKEIEKPLDYRM
jgi:hypothetical protein